MIPVDENINNFCFRSVFYVFSSYSSSLPPPALHDFPAITLFLSIFQRISAKLGLYIGSTSCINPVNFQVRTPNVKVTVRHDKNAVGARICKWHDIV